MIAFLHTSEKHIGRFQQLVERYFPEQEVTHFVNSSLLEEALQTGHLNAIAFDQQINEIVNGNPERIICTCSTIGPLCESYPKVFRIDVPITRYLVQKYKRIALVYTAKSTLTVSKALLQSTAEKANKEIKIFECNCSASWPYFMQGNIDFYLKSIAQKIQTFEYEVDAVFLAQASMEGAKAYLRKYANKIYASPEFGIRELLDL